MKVKRLVYDEATGRYVERYVDMGPGAAKPMRSGSHTHVSSGGYRYGKGGKDS